MEIIVQNGMYRWDKWRETLININVTHGELNLQSYNFLTAMPKIDKKVFHTMIVQKEGDEIRTWQHMRRK